MHKHIVTHTYTNTFSCLPSISYSAILKEEVSVLRQMDIYRNIYNIKKEKRKKKKALDNSLTSVAACVTVNAKAGWFP